MTVSPAAVALLALMRLRGVGRRAALRLVVCPRSDQDAESYRAEVMANASRAKLPVAEASEAWLRIAEHLEESAEVGVRAIDYFDALYPDRLRRTPDPPAVLFVKGAIEALHSPCALAVVGTREPTAYGVEVARRSAEAAVEFGFSIVSGLAHGCDTYGHEGCVDRNGVGIAVLAHGLDRVYPVASRPLADRLLENGGCLVSEYPNGVTPMRTAFAERDRIQSGLSDGVLVIETDIKGGTMHTVRFARDQHRPLACIEHPMKWRLEEKTRGNQKLIADRIAVAIPDRTALVKFLENLSATAGRLRVEKTPIRQPEQQSWNF